MCLNLQRPSPESAAPASGGDTSTLFFFFRGFHSYVCRLSENLKSRNLLNSLGSWVELYQKHKQGLQVLNDKSQDFNDYLTTNKISNNVWTSWREKFLTAELTTFSQRWFLLYGEALHAWTDKRVICLFEQRTRAEAVFFTQRPRVSAVLKALQ